MGALRSGAGLVFLGVPESIYAIEAVKLNEAIVFPLPDEDGKLSTAAIPEILERLPQMDAVLIGPGLGQSNDTLAVVSMVLKAAQSPVVLDADGINLIAAHKDIVRGRTNPTILTPHDGEFARLGGSMDVDRLLAAEAMARELGSILLLKGHRTVVSDGSTTYINTTGNPGMAVGGSGDVLAGIITAFVGQGVDPLQAAACGAWVHGAAGDICAAQIGQYGMLPTDMGVNMAGYCIIDNDACEEASKQEVLRRYYKARCDYKNGQGTKGTIERLRVLMSKLQVSANDRKVIASALIKNQIADGKGAVAIELPDGQIVTGRNTKLMSAAAAAVFNAVKTIGKIDDDIDLIAPVVIEPIISLKSKVLHEKHTPLSLEEALLALSVCAATNPLAAKAVKKLEMLAGCEAHSSHMLFKADENPMRKLGMHLTCEPEFLDNNLFIN